MKCWYGTNTGDEVLVLHGTAVTAGNAGLNTGNEGMVQHEYGQ